MNAVARLFPQFMTRLHLAAGVLVVVVFAVLVGSGMRWYYGNALADARVRENNLLAELDTTRTVAGGAERRAFIAENEKELAEALNERQQDYMNDQDRRLRAVAGALVALETRLGVDATAVAHGDSTEIPWEYHDRSIDVRLRLGFPGQIAPNPEPPVTGRIDLSARVRPTIAISCGPDGVFSNATVDDERFSIEELQTTMAEDVACIKRPGFPRLFPRLEPATGIAVAVGLVLGLALR
jgi:hypothetical protein